MEKRELVCIRCPLGCALTATREGEANIKVTGNTCPRGEEYAISEWLNPQRMLTSTVRIKGEKNLVVSVKTKTDIPKDKILECVKELSEIEVELPISIGDVIIENVGGTGVPVIATKNYLV